MQSARISPDGRWLAFHLNRGFEGKRIVLAPFRGGSPSREEDWLALTPDREVSEEPWWSPAGRFLYYLSDRDGRRCVWAQELDTESGRPLRSPAPIVHFHRTALSALSKVRLRSAAVGLSVGRNRLVFSLAEITSNIWLAELPQADR